MIMKTTHKNARVALLSSFTLVAGLALAADDYPTNPERSFTTMQAPAEKSSSTRSGTTRSRPTVTRSSAASAATR